jgi:hypothetical protein
MKKKNKIMLQEQRQRNSTNREGKSFFKNITLYIPNPKGFILQPFK